SELPALATGTVGVPNPVGRFPYTEQFSIGAQRQVASNMAISADFVHTLGLHFPRSYNVNARQPDGSYPLVANGRIMNVNDYGNRIHGNQLQLRLDRRLANNLSFQSSYTYLRLFQFQNVPVDKQNRNADYGPATNDVRHRLVLSGVYMLPFAIQLGAVMTASSAAPYTIITGFDSNGDRDVNERPIVDGQMIPPNSARGDSYFDTDLRISKRFNVRSRQLEILWEMFNLFNTKNFGGYQGNQRSVLFGQPTFALAPFQGQLGIRFDF
ncbi:MAG: TonB-dependent receptor, partial [Acidobacteria bacterium]|nr:TonB-dependent receptor [Acidobacteriota bacterium]